MLTVKHLPSDRRNMMMARCPRVQVIATIGEMSLGSIGTGTTAVTAMAGAGTELEMVQRGVQEGNMTITAVAKVGVIDIEKETGTETEASIVIGEELIVMPREAGTRAGVGVGV